MKNKLAVLALGLWGITVVVLATMFVRGNTAPATDGRTAVILRDSERDLVLTEMRGMLLAVRGVAEGLAGNQRAEIAQAARDGGGGAMRDVPVSLMAKLPLEFKEMGMAMHAGFDALASAADQGEATDKLLGLLTGQLNQCVACHQSFRINPERQ